MSLRVVEPGLFTLPVGAARPGRRHLGLSAGGPADVAAWVLANALVGNITGGVALEITLAGPTLTATVDTHCALVGAPFSVAIAGREVEPGGAFTLGEGRTLRVGGTPTGVRAVLAVAGGFDTTDARPVARGDLLECSASRGPARRLPGATTAEVLGDTPGVLRGLPGPEHDWFPGAGVFGPAFTVAPASNRMGVRLTGEPVVKRPGELRSSPVAPGIVQVAHDGRPIILGVDGQTIGGYPRAAVVIRADLDAVGQLRPGSGVRFSPVTPAEAEAFARARAAALRLWVRRLAA